MRFCAEKIWTTAALALLASASTAMAQSIPAGGFDLFQTDRGAYVTFNGSNVSLNGVPITSGNGTTDTIIERTSSYVQGQPISTAVYALALKSASPVTVTNSQGQQVQADLWVIVNNSGNVTTLPTTSNSTSTGSLSLSFNEQGTGGTFSSSMTVNAELYFVTPNSNDPANSSTYVTSPAAAPQISLSSTNSTFQTTAPSGDQHNKTYPANGFYPTQVKHTGPHPIIPPVPCTSCCKLCCTATTIANARKLGPEQEKAALAVCRTNPVSSDTNKQ
jgi:hypothetical protein